MGYAVGGLVHVGQILRTTRTTGKRVIDLGSQDVTIFDDADAENLRCFVEEFGGDPNSLKGNLKAPFPIIMSAADIFAAAGFDYRCCDVDRRPGTVYVDFNTLAFDQSLYGQFDLVLNAGTTEHLPNPLAAFFFMHHLCRRGGLLYNEVPVSGWFNHGLNNLTPKFWHTLRWMNSYEVITAVIKPVNGDAANDGNFGGKHLDFIENLSEIEQHSASIQIIFQKVEDRGFVPPFDAVLPEDGSGKAVADLVRASLLPFVACGSLSRAAAAASVNAFLSKQNLSYRIQTPIARRLSQLKSRARRVFGTD
jgi:hypothetical protein